MARILYSNFMKTHFWAMPGFRQYFPGGFKKEWGLKTMQYDHRVLKMATASFVGSSVTSMAMTWERTHDWKETAKKPLDEIPTSLLLSSMWFVYPIAIPIALFLAHKRAGCNNIICLLD